LEELRGLQVRVVGLVIGRVCPSAAGASQAPEKAAMSVHYLQKKTMGPGASRCLPLLVPRGPGSWPGYVFTGAPLHLPANHFGLGLGGRAHAPDEYLVIDSTNPRVQGFDGAARAYVEFLYGIAESA
jgi:hypothetical protein